jgi:hypothetical protein
MIDQLIHAYQTKRLILFVGAGASMNLGLPSWQQLVNHMAVELGYDPDIYQTFGGHLTLAEFYRRSKHGIGPLRSWMDREWHPNKINIANSRIHELIANASFDIIYTTNYDRWLERSFEYYKKPYTKISGVADLIKTVAGGAQIIKFHGDFDDDASIVLDETSYFDRLSFESPLDIKFRSDVLGRSVLFIGYSLTDINIRYLFYKLANTWKKSSCTVSQPHSYVFTGRPNAIQEAVLDQWNIKMISTQEDDPETALIKFLESFL